MKSKVKSVYTCNNCGYQNSKWLGKCPECGKWNTFIEEIFYNTKKERTKATSNPNKIKKLDDISIKESQRITGSIPEFDRLLGGGIVPGSLILLSGEPGIGKSTLLLQIADLYSNNNKVLYVSAEESEQQIKIRASRLKIENKNLYILIESNILLINDMIDRIKPDIIILDSIQTISNPEIGTICGTVTQIRECTNIFMDKIKKMGNALFLVGHVTKDGTIAGPKILEHMVDVVLYMEGEQHYQFRLLKSNKNRFGSTSEIAIFEMTGNGLSVINNPSSYFIDQNKQNLPGAVITTVMEGTRPIMVELQSLVTPTNMAYPRRICEGMDNNKVLLIAAILEKIVGINLNSQEIYTKVTGGLKIIEPAIDLGIAASILSSYKNIPIVNKTVFIGELGLTGEIRPIAFIEQRIKEVEKLGFRTAIIPKQNKKNIKNKFSKINIISLEYINEIITLLDANKGGNDV